MLFTMTENRGVYAVSSVDFMVFPPLQHELDQRVGAENDDEQHGDRRTAQDSFEGFKFHMIGSFSVFLVIALIGNRICPDEFGKFLVFCEVPLFTA